MYFIDGHQLIQTDKICFGFIILLAVLMSLIERMLDNITQKQQETISKLDTSFKTLLCSNGKNFMMKLTTIFGDHLEESLTKHSNKIRQFLFVQNADNEQFLFQEQQPLSINVSPEQKYQQKEKHIKSKLSEQNIVSNEQLKKRKKIIGFDQDIAQNPELKIVLKNKKNIQSQFLEQSNPSQQFTNHKIIQTNNDKKHKNFNIRQKDKTQSRIKKQLATLGKSDSRKNGESRKTLQEENFNVRGKRYKQKSRKMRTNLIKLSPIAQEKQKQMKRKEANQRIQAALQFLNNLPSKSKAISLSPTQWKQQKSQKFLLNKNNSSSMNPKNIKLKELSYKYRLQKSRELQAYLLQMSDYSPSQYRLQKRDRFSLQKPQAYNLYNINMQKNEVFQLKICD